MPRVRSFVDQAHRLFSALGRILAPLGLVFLFSVVGAQAKQPAVTVDFYVPNADISTTTLQEAKKVARSSEPEERRKAIEFFAWQASKYADTAKDEIVSALNDPDASVRSEAAVAFKNLKSLNRLEVEGRLYLLWHRDRFAAALASAYRGIVNQGVADELLAGLRRGEPFSDDAAGGFAILGSSAAALVQNDLVGLIGSQDGALSCNALMVLAKTRSAPASLVKPMREWIQKGRYCDWQAAAVLGSIGPPAAEAVPDLVNRIRGKAGECCSWDAQYLVSIGTASIPALLSVAREKDEYRRAWASWTLAQLAGDPGVPLDTLDRALCDPSSEVVFRTKDGLGRVGGKNGRLAQLFDVRRQEFRSKTCQGSYRPPAAAVPRVALPPLDESALERDIVPELIRQLDGPNRQEALRTLSELGPYAASAVPVLLQDLPKAGTDDRRAIARMLGSIGAEPERAVPALVELLKDSDSWTSNGAFESLALFGNEARQAIPSMLGMLKAGKVNRYSEENFAALRGPAARAAIPYYRRLSTDEDEGKASRGIRMMLLIATTDTVARKAALAEARRGSSIRRCLIAGELLQGLGDMPEIKDLPSFSDAFCRKYLEGQQGFIQSMSRLPGEQQRDSYPRLKIRLSLTKRTFFVGEPIEVTPDIQGWPEPSEKYPRPSFYRDGEGGGGDGLDLIPEIRTSSGALVDAGGASDIMFGEFRGRRRGAAVSWRMGNMMANGIVLPRPGSTYTIGRPATVFIRSPGIYTLSFPETLAHIEDSTGPLNVVSADPIIDVKVIRASDAFITETLREIEIDLASSDAMVRGWATERLRNLNHERAIPVLLRCLEDEYRNVLVPAIFGLLEFSPPQSVAREIRKAIAQGLPTRPTQMTWYAEILARTEHGWPGTDARSRIQVDADSAKWQLLLERRQAKALESGPLTAEEAMEGLSNGLISPKIQGACDAAWNGLFAATNDRQFQVAGQIIEKCGSKKSSSILWKIARSDKFDSIARSSASRKLYDLGDKEALHFILADMGSPHPVLDHTIGSLPIIKADPEAVADIVMRKLASDDAMQTRFAATLLWGIDAGIEKGINLPLDPEKLRATLLACRETACDSVTWGHVARYLSSRSPKDGLAIVEAMLLRCGQDRFAGCTGPIQILATLPSDVGGPLVRKMLNSSDKRTSVDMLRELASAPNKQGKPYFRDILALFEKNPSDEARGYAAVALQRASGLPPSGFPSINGYAAIDAETASRCVPRWEAWLKANGGK